MSSTSSSLTSIQSATEGPTSESLEDRTDYWLERWTKGRAGYHMTQVNPYLLKYIDELTLSMKSNKGGADHKPLNIFVPLCGKSKDIPYLISLGHKVFGVEFLDTIVQQLGAENGFHWKNKTEKDCLYETVDGKLKIYVGDLFDCPIEKWGPFDCIWDRASLIAVEYSSREKYIQIIQRSLRNPAGNYVNFRYLLASVRYDKKKFYGVPYTLDEDELQNLFGSWCEIEYLEKIPLSESHQVQRAGGMGYEYFHFLNLRNLS